MINFLSEMSKPQFTGWLVLISCLVFAYIGWMGHDDDSMGGGAGA